MANTRLENELLRFTEILSQNCCNWSVLSMPILDTLIYDKSVFFLSQFTMFITKSIYNLVQNLGINSYQFIMFLSDPFYNLPEKGKENILPISLFYWWQGSILFILSPLSLVILIRFYLYVFVVMYTTPYRR